MSSRKAKRILQTRVPKKSIKKSNVDQWLERETPHKKEALENASMHFDEKDNLTVNTLEVIYGQESSFGKLRRKRNIDGAAGEFHLEKATAKRMGLIVNTKNDQRFDVDHASAGSGKYLKELDMIFSKATTLKGQLKTTPIEDASKRVEFAVAAFNAGEGRIAKAQGITKELGGDPSSWNDVQENLEAAGASEKKATEIRDYVKKVMEYEKEFSKKSPANKQAKHQKPKKTKKAPIGGHWITHDGRHIFIEE